MRSDTPTAPPGLLIVWTDVAPDIENDFNAWYNHEHLPDRVLRMPGFLRGRRYVAQGQTAGAPKFLTLYDLQDTAVMLSQAHTTLRKDRPARDRLFVPQFRNTIKGICDVACRAGRGDGSYLVLLPVVAAAGHELVFTQGVCAKLLPEIAALRGIASAVFATRNAAVTQASSAKDDRAGDRYVEDLLAVEAANEASATAALAQLNSDNLALLGGEPHLVEAPCVLRLAFDLRAPGINPS